MAGAVGSSSSTTLPVPSPAISPFTTTTAPTVVLPSSSRAARDLNACCKSLSGPPEIAHRRVPPLRVARRSHCGRWVVPWLERRDEPEFGVVGGERASEISTVRLSSSTETAGKRAAGHHPACPTVGLNGCRHARDHLLDDAHDLDADRRQLTLCAAPPASSPWSRSAGLPSTSAFGMYDTLADSRRRSACRWTRTGAGGPDLRA